MPNINLGITVFPSNIAFYKNEYNEQFQTEMFKEQIRVDPVNCVYRQWSGSFGVNAPKD